MATVYCLRVIRLEELRWKHYLHRKKPSLYVEARVDFESDRTRTVARSTSPTWDEDLIFSLSQEHATFSIHVKRDSSWSAVTCIGHVDIELSDLLAKCANGEASFWLLPATGQATDETIGTIVLHFDKKTIDAAANIRIEAARQDAQRLVLTETTGNSNTTKQMLTPPIVRGSRADLYRAIERFLSRLDPLKKVVISVSEIHPLFKITWGVTSCPLDAVSHTFKTDAKIVDLVTSMEDVFSFVEDIEMLSEKVHRLREPITGLLKQTIECCIFIRQYSSPSFFRRMLNISSSEKMDEFQRSFSDFKRKIKTGIIVKTAIVCFQVSKGINNIVLKQKLEPAGIGNPDRPVCLPGTRLDVREQILEWIFSDAKQNVFWLHGVAGSGKSTICTTIAQHLRDMSRLGAHIFFERGKSEPSSDIRTIAYNLALVDSNIESSILSGLDHERNVLTALLSHQFDKLLLQPLRAAAESLSGPIVVVLDALDECGTHQTRESLLQLLEREFPKLPNKFRFVISSRREHDIDNALSSRPDSVHEVELDYRSSANHQDLLLYIRNEMHRVVVVREKIAIQSDWSWDAKMAVLGKAADGLFIWASTAIRLVSMSPNPFGTLEELVSNSQSPAEFGLYPLYATALQNSGIDWTMNTSRTRFQRVMGLLLLSKVPLSVQEIDGILGYPSRESSEHLLARLRCVLTYSAKGPVGLLHASFSDYLTSSKREDPTADRKVPWFIHNATQNNFIASCCFSVMERLLHFNMCSLDSSFVRNADVPELEKRIKEHNSSHLSYACLHWSHHLCEASYSDDLLKMLSDFARSRLLFWFEVLSLAKVFPLASPALLNASKWAEKSGSDCSSFLKDASKLASEFAFPISQSTPHIYTSMIPLTKDGSRVSAHYFNRMSSLVLVETRGIKRPPRWLKVLEGHRDRVRSIAVSSDGRHIASGSEDGTVRVWDADSGEQVLLLDRPNAVFSVSFSPDGTRLASGSVDGTLRMWNVEDIRVICGPLKQHAKGILSLSYSPDGKKIASDAADKMIIIWNALSGEVIAGPFEGHTDIVRSVAISPDGKRVASCSDDRTIRMWNVKNGELALEPLTGHTHPVSSVAFSPDGEHIVSGSEDATIRVWEAKSGNVVRSPFLGHTYAVTSVAYSDDGTRIVSGSFDNTICVWDAKTGSIVSGPLEGHADAVSCVAFSSDGARVISGSWDSTVRIWSATDLKTDTGPPSSGHKGAVSEVLFSADGNRIASCSFDGSIAIWNARNGELVAGPFEDNSKNVNGIAFSTDNAWLISGSDDCNARIWDVESGKVVHVLRGHMDEVWCVALSPDDSRIVSGSRDGTIRVWSMSDGKILAGPLSDHSGGIQAITFSPDGKLFASSSRDGTIRLRDAINWEPNSRHLKYGRCIPDAVCFSPDSKSIAAGTEDGSIILWNVKSSKAIGDAIGRHISRVWSVIFTLDGTHVISCSQDRTIKVWNIQTRQIVCDALEGHSSTVRSLALSPDGVRLVSGSEDYTIRVWDLSGLFGRTTEEDSTKSNSIVSKGQAEWVLGNNGWILSGHNRRDLLLWIPPDLRRTLWNPRNTAVFSCQFSTKLDFTNAALGDRWTECFTP